MNCSVCKKPGGLKCAKCLARWYCGRDCQRADWPAHKLNCMTAKELEAARKQTYERFIPYAHKRISGNIAIMFAWHGPGIVRIEINELIEEFARGNGSMHFAHAVHTGDSDRYIVEYYFPASDYRIVIIEHVNDIAEIKNKYPCPELEWTILFEI